MSNETTPAIERAAGALAYELGESLHPDHLAEARAMLATALDIEELAQELKGHVSFYFDGTTYRCSCQHALGWKATEVQALYLAHQAAAVRVALLGGVS